MMTTWTRDDNFKDGDRCAQAPDDDEVGEEYGGPGEAVGEGSSNREHLVK